MKTAEAIPTDFDTVVAEHYPRIYRAALVLSGNAWDAEDLAQETFLQALRSQASFAGRSQPGTWFYAILLNQHRKRLRGHERAWRRVKQWLGRILRHPRDESPDGRLLLQEWREGLWGSVGQLPPTQRYAVVLRYSEGLSYDEISEVLGCPIGTVKSRIHHALAALQRRLGDQP